MPKWARDYLVLPLAVGLIVATVTFGLPKIFSEKLELSYEVDGPTSHFIDPAESDLKILVNGKPVGWVSVFRIRIWNSGDKPIKKLPVRLVFEPKQGGFSIFSIRHNTSPQYEFGAISDLESENTSRRFQYDLLNKDDQDIITVLTNKKVLGSGL